MNENKQVKLVVWNLDTDEIENVFMDEQDYQDMIAYEAEIEKKDQERRKRLRQEEAYAARFDRNY